MASFAAYQAGIRMSRIREERFLSRRAVVRATLHPPVRLGGLWTGLSLDITKSGQEPNGIKLSPKQSQHQEVTEL
jgi:hypothetical protein